MNVNVVRSLFDYDADTGLFLNKVRRSSTALIGRKVGTLDTHGYWSCKLGGTKYYIHRLVWIYVYGSIPVGFSVDHINGDRSDNRLSNLRLVDATQNVMNRGINKNNSSGCKGVSFDPKIGKFESYIWSGYRKIRLGLFSNIFDAACARRSAEDMMFGEYARAT